jgi:hypothetical protein
MRRDRADLMVKIQNVLNDSQATHSFNERYVEGLKNVSQIISCLIEMELI